MQNLDNITQNLNPEQISAVQHINGPLLIIAGAGSGKTTVLTRRVAYMIANDVDPSSILTLTFTNKAANEIKERISGLINYFASKQIWAGTFHSIFARILRMEATTIGYDSNFSIYDSDDQLSAVKSVMQRLGISQQMYPPSQIRSVISSNKNKLIDAKEFMKEAKSTFNKQAALVYENYDGYLRENNAMDFDDLIINMIYLFGKSPETLHKYQDKFKYIMVDEYQDTNRAQYIIINLLAKAHQNICVVGDDAQSIYRWRGADIRNILDFQKDYPYAKTIRLEQNYRSTKTILAAADCVIKNNVNQIAKKLWTENDEGEKIDLIAAFDDREESQKIAEKIMFQSNYLYDYKDIAILYRTNAQSLQLENALRGQRIPYEIFGGISFFKRKEIKDTICYIRFLLNTNDGEALQRVINEPPRGIGKTSLDHILMWVKDMGFPLYEGFRNVTRIEALQNRAKVACTKFYSFIESWKAKIGTMPNDELIADYIKETGILEMYQEIGTDDSLDKWNNIQQLLSDISDFFTDNPEAKIEDYLNQVALISDLDEKKDTENKITLMTLHSAKGLEFPMVIIAGLEEGLFPLTRQDQDDDEIEEERRLFYVGITRAKSKLFLSFAQKRSRFGETSPQYPSKFLRELTPTLINTHGFPLFKAGIGSQSINSSSNNYSQIPKNYTQNKPNFSQPPRASSSYSQEPTYNEYSQIPQNVQTFKFGDKVKHSKFGPGTITGIKGEGDLQQATVRFDSIGKKNLMLKFARLEKM